LTRSIKPATAAVFAENTDQTEPAPPFWENPPETDAPPPIGDDPSRSYEDFDEVPF
jgi:hypothetical protein